MKKILSIAAALLVVLSCNEELSYDRYEILPPVVDAIWPVEATIDTQVTITGENLNNVNSVTIGGYEVEIMSKVSDKELIVYASSTGRSGSVEVFAADGSSSASSQSFSYKYVAPTLDAVELADSGEIGDSYYISGTMLNVVEEVFFVAYSAQDALSENRDVVSAEILTQTARDIVVKLPFVSAEHAKISLSYFDGEEHVTTDASQKAVEIVRLIPVVSTNYFPTTDVGLRMTIGGENLDKIENVFIGGFDAEISSQSASSLTFKVPAGDFVDGANPSNQIVISYFDAQATQVLSSDFTVYVPMVKFWEDVLLGCQDKSVYTANFFSLEDGIVYDNALYATMVDPIACQYINYDNSSTWDGTTCLASNVPAVSQAEYDQVNPYIYITSQSSGGVFFTSPANSYSSIRNFYIDGSSTTVYGGSKASFAGTPVVYYRYLNPLITAERVLANKVINKQITTIDLDEFPIDDALKTIAGVNLDKDNGGTAASGSIGHTLDTQGWAGTTSVELGQKIEPNTVIMVLYYDHNGYSTNSLSNNTNIVGHIKKIGFIHVKEFTFASSTNDVAKATASSVLADIWWQKYPNQTQD